MALTKDRLIADDADLAHSDKVASYIISAGEAAITSTNISSKEALDVNVVNEIAVDLDHTTDSIQLGDGTTLVNVTLSNELKVNDADANTALSAIQTAVEILDNAISGSEMQVDIVSDLPLAYADDSVTAHQGGTWTIDSITNVVSIDDNSGSITVDASDLDIRDLAYATDSVTVYQGTDPWVVSGTVIPAVPNASILATAVAGSATAVALPASPLANRKNIYIQNNTNTDIFIGSAAVTLASGLRIAKGATLDFPFGPSVAVYAIGEAAISGNINVLEIA